MTYKGDLKLLQRLRTLRHSVKSFPNQTKIISEMIHDNVSEVSYSALVEIRENLDEVINGIEEIVRYSKILEGSIEKVDAKLSPMIQERAKETRWWANARLENDDIEEELQQDRRTLEERFIQTKRKFKEK